jgi:hypothetical protein
MEKRTELYLFPGKVNPEVFVKGRATERAKEERKTEAFDRYFEMLKARKQALAEHEPPEEKRPRIKQPTFPVDSSYSPVIQNRE